jgi:hypothetical protein
MTLPEAPILAAITEAIAWLKQSGWTTRADDFEVARQMVGRGGTQPGQLQLLTDAFGGPSQSDSIHRAVLCCVVMRAAEAASGPTTGGR